jgi:hypothetical protein
VYDVSALLLSCRPIDSLDIPSAQYEISANITHGIACSGMCDKQRIGPCIVDIVKI